MNRLDLPDDKEIAKQIVEADAQHTTAKMEMGWLGRLFGGKHAPNNIAGLIVVLSFISIVAVLVLKADTSLSTKDVLTILAGFVTLGLGFIFGRVSQ